MNTLQSLAEEFRCYGFDDVEQLTLDEGSSSNSEVSSMIFLKKKCW